ncbi:hypothetical protein Acr_00g0053490 [Actinidia rufa]|uniref:Uncharacterized protein n=1 Tax=Actinidia rufa TaxID=165716 RepID=A0A7J0DLC9_9ERIC|nr:hypothetical protein Acr_00g0053490 [Actinidia rufa]
MGSHSSNHTNSRETREEASHAPKTPWCRGGKLLEDAQRVAKATSGQKPGRLLPGGADSRDIIIERLQRQLAELTQLMVNSRPTRSGREGEARPSWPKNKVLTQNPQEGQSKKKDKTHVSMDKRTVAMSKQRRTLDRTKMEVDLRDTRNAKRNKEEDLSSKLDGRRGTGAGERVPTVSMARVAPNEPREAVPRYQTPFSQHIEGLDPSKKFTPSRFTLYDGKSDPRSHVSHVRQMMALWNHMDALMCWDLMSWVKIFARLEDDVKQAEKVTGTNSRSEGLFKKRRDNPIDFESWARQGINVVFKEQIHKLLARKSDPMGGDPKRRNQRERTVDEEEDRSLGTIHMIGGLHDLDLKNRIKGEILILRQILEVLLVHSSTKKLRKEAAELGSITFTKANLERVQHPHSDPLVIQLRMNNYDVRRILMAWEAQSR